MTTAKDLQDTPGPSPPSHKKGDGQTDKGISTQPSQTGQNTDIGRPDLTGLASHPNKDNKSETTTNDLQDHPYEILCISYERTAPI